MKFQLQLPQGLRPRCTWVPILKQLKYSLNEKTNHIYVAIDFDCYVDDLDFFLFKQGGLNPVW